LSEGQRRFSELRRAMPAISAKVLSARLKDLEERGVLSRRDTAHAESDRASIELFKRPLTLQLR
jgi:DNA-binding HxlR family transcriptional regulator